MADSSVLVQQLQTSTVLVEVLRTQVVELQGQAPVVDAEAPAVLIQGMQPGAMVLQPVMATEVVAVGVQGPPGRAGLDANAVAGALVVAKRLSEYSQDPAAQTDVQRNIGLGAIDPLAHYILAKS